MVRAFGKLTLCLVLLNICGSRAVGDGICYLFALENSNTLHVVQLNVHVFSCLVLLDLVHCLLSGLVDQQHCAAEKFPTS